MLDKNHNNQLIDDSQITSFLEHNVMNFVMYSEPFVKTVFSIKLINMIEMPIVYLDFDLLYSGYITSKVLSKPDKVSLLQPSKDNLKTILNQIIMKFGKG